VPKTIHLKDREGNIILTLDNGEDDEYYDSDEEGSEQEGEEDESGSDDDRKR
jgi:hypothetical protein